MSGCHGVSGKISIQYVAMGPIHWFNAWNIAQHSNGHELISTSVDACSLCKQWPYSTHMITWIDTAWSVDDAPPMCIFTYIDKPTGLMTLIDLANVRSIVTFCTALAFGSPIRTYICLYSVNIAANWVIPRVCRSLIFCQPFEMSISCCVVTPWIMVQLRSWTVSIPETEL